MGRGVEGGGGGWRGVEGWRGGGQIRKHADLNWSFILPPLPWQVGHPPLIQKSSPYNGSIYYEYVTKHILQSIVCNIVYKFLATKNKTGYPLGSWASCNPEPQNPKPQSPKPKSLKSSNSKPLKP